MEPGEYQSNRLIRVVRKSAGNRSRAYGEGDKLGNLEWMAAEDLLAGGWVRLILQQHQIANGPAYPHHTRTIT